MKTSRHKYDPNDSSSEEEPTGAAIGGRLQQLKTADEKKNREFGWRNRVRSKSPEAHSNQSLERGKKSFFGTYKNFTPGHQVETTNEVEPSTFLGFGSGSSHKQQQQQQKGKSSGVWSNPRKERMQKPKDILPTPSMVPRHRAQEQLRNDVAEQNPAVSPSSNRSAPIRSPSQVEEWPKTPPKQERKPPDIKPGMIGSLFRRTHGDNDDVNDESQNKKPTEHPQRGMLGALLQQQSGEQEALEAKMKRGGSEFSNAGEESIADMSVFSHHSTKKMAHHRQFMMDENQNSFRSESGFSLTPEEHETKEKRPWRRQSQLRRGSNLGALSGAAAAAAAAHLAFQHHKYHPRSGFGNNTGGMLGAVDIQEDSDEEDALLYKPPAEMAHSYAAGDPNAESVANFGAQGFDDVWKDGQMSIVGMTPNKSMIQAAAALLQQNPELEDDNYIEQEDEQERFYEDPKKRRMTMGRGLKIENTYEAEMIDKLGEFNDDDGGDEEAYIEAKFADRLSGDNGKISGKNTQEGSSLSSSNKKKRPVRKGSAATEESNSEDADQESESFDGLFQETSGDINNFREKKMMMRDTGHGKKKGRSRNRDRGSKYHDSSQSELDELERSKQKKGRKKKEYYSDSSSRGKKKTPKKSKSGSSDEEGTGRSRRKKKKKKDENSESTMQPKDKEGAKKEANRGLRKSPNRGKNKEEDTTKTASKSAVNERKTKNVKNDQKLIKERVKMKNRGGRNNEKLNEEERDRAFETGPWQDSRPKTDRIEDLSGLKTSDMLHVKSKWADGTRSITDNSHSSLGSGDDASRSKPKPSGREKHLRMNVLKKFGKKHARLEENEEENAGLLEQNDRRRGRRRMSLDIRGLNPRRRGKADADKHSADRNHILKKDENNGWGSIVGEVSGRGEKVSGIRNTSHLYSRNRSESPVRKVEQPSIERRSSSLSQIKRMSEDFGDQDRGRKNDRGRKRGKKKKKDREESSNSSKAKSRKSESRERNLSTEPPKKPPKKPSKKSKRSKSSPRRPLSPSNEKKTQSRHRSKAPDFFDLGSNAKDTKRSEDSADVGLLTDPGAQRQVSDSKSTEQRKSESSSKSKTKKKKKKRARD